MELEPGFIVREPMPFGRRVSYDGLFTRYVDELDGVLGGSDSGLAGASARVGDGVPQDLDSAYDGTIGVAADAHAAQVGAGSGSQAGSLISDGGNVDTLRASVLGYLPQPDAPVDTSFVDPPDGAVVHTGRGFDTPKPEPPPPNAPPPVGPDPGTIHEDIVKEQVRQLYLELLNREPDAQGWADWVAQVLSGAITIEDVRAAIINSDEYRQLHGG